MNRIHLCLFSLLVPGLLFAQGSVLLVGGGREYDTWADEPYGWFVQAADSGKIINIDVDEVSSYYPSYFRSLGADNSSEAFRISNRQVANDSLTYQKLISARGIFIEGGDQSDYVKTWKGTLVEDAIHYVFRTGGAIGGTSAGLAVLGEVVYDATGGYLYPYKAAYNPYHPDIHFTDDFLNILPGVLTDSHFHSRGRLARLVPMLARRIVDNGQDDLMGIGICDNTALCIDSDGNATVCGDATVTIIYKSNESVIDCQPGVPVTFTNIVFHQLPRGAVFHLKSRQLVDPGPYLVPVTDYRIDSLFSPVALSGIDDMAANWGSRVIENITAQKLAAWKGLLEQKPGDNRVPNSVIINKLLWENPRTETYYYENRWIGGIWGIADRPGWRAIYLNGDRNHSQYNALATITADGNLTINQGIVYLLDTDGISYYCPDYTRAGNRKTNYRGMVNARLHFLKQGDEFDLGGKASNLKRQTRTGSIRHFKLYQNYPNPFNAATKIQFSLAETGVIELSVYNIQGKFVASIAAGWYEPGRHSVTWDGSNHYGAPLPSGIYFCCFKAGEKVISRKIVLLR